MQTIASCASAARRAKRGACGLVVGLIDEASYSPPHTAADWGYLETGVLIEAEDAGLTHYSEPDEAWRLLARA